MTAPTRTGLVPDPDRRKLFDLPVDAITLDQAVHRCVQAIAQRRYLPVGVVNAAKIVTMRRDRALRDAVTQCPMILADGQSVVWAGRILGAPLPERVAGIDLFERLLAVAARSGYRVFFLGAKPDVLRRMLAEVARRFPGLTVAGARDGYYGSAEAAEVAAQIRSSGADLLFLGMSSPRKELFVAAHGEATGAPVVHGVGGSFDVLAGVTRRAPQWYQQNGLEWLYRARQEPARLGRRYLVTNAAFMALVARELAAVRLGAGGATLSAAGRRPT
jgi:N-acetylglucosaminyldiphosphoundecaprenol N-acetyl-beta-D-mannosaminyltransferase